MKAHRDLLRYVYKRGFKVKFEEYDNGDPITPEGVMEAIEIVECVDGGYDFDIVKPDGGYGGWVKLAIGYGNMDDETVADFTCGGIVDEWFGQVDL